MHEAAKRGVFAYIVDDDADSLQSAIDITLQRFAEYQSLQGAFGRRALIEQAKGILMARHAIDANGAFGCCGTIHSHNGQKVVNVAQAIVDSHLLLLPPRPQPAAGLRAVLVTASTTRRPAPARARRRGADAAYSRAVEFKELLRRRRMVRAYEPEPVPRETLERIVGTIRRAPSAGFSQGQRLVVVAEPERRRAIAEAVEENFYVEQGFAPWISGAAALVVVCTREDDYHDRYRQPDKLQEGEEIAWPVPYWYADAGAAAMLILLAAIDEGLAAGVFGIPAERMERVREPAGAPKCSSPSSR